METRAAAERSEATRVTKPKNKIRKRCTGRIPRRCDRGYALNHLLSDVHLSKDMAEQDTDHRHTAEDKGQESQSTNMDQECKQEKTDIVKQQLSEASSSASTNRETNDSAENTAQTDVENLVYGSDHIPDSDSAGERMVPPTERSLPPEDDTALNVKDNSNPLQAEEGSRGVYERGEPAEISRKKHPGEKKAPETTSPPTLDSKNDDQVDGSDEGTPDSNATNTDAGEDDESCPEKEDEDTQVNTSSTKTAEDVQTIGPTTQEPVDVEPAIPGPIGNHGGSLGFTVLIAVGVFGIVIALLGQHLFQPKSPPQKDELRQIDIFLRQLEKVQTRFPNQRAELWSRSKIHLLRHLQTAQPTEPVSLILTAGHRGEKTLHCLAQRLASAFSSSLNASVLHIDGASKASQDSDQVKLDIDSKLRGAFEGDKPVAVINRFEELPPGSTLIFYRYCDHENAAYKKTCLIFTVLLGEEEEIPAETRLSTVEEMVDDHLQKKFLSDGHPVSFDRMDLDKYGGLWSRISHLILPVAAEERIERDGC